MKKVFTVLSFLFVTLWLSAQTNPTPHNLGASNFIFTGFATGAETTYPPSMQGWAFGSEPSAATLTPATQDRTLDASTASATSGNIKNEAASGLSFLNSSSNNIGAICVAINTQGRNNITVSWTAEDIRTGSTRENGLKLQYRIGNNGNFVDVANADYLSSPTIQNPPQNFVNIPLPSIVENEPEVQLRWLYYFSTGSGSRDRIRLDDIEISSLGASSQAIITGQVTGAPFCINTSKPDSGSVAFSAVGTYAETFSVLLSDATGSFASPTTIGTQTVNGTDPTGNINMVIPPAIASGNQYKLRIDGTTIQGSETAAFQVINGVENATGFTALIDNQLVNLQWQNPTSCFTEVLVVAATSSIAAFPTGNGSAYTADSSFIGNGSVLGNGIVVYKGDGQNINIIDLTNNQNYYFKIFSRLGTNWSSGIEINATPEVFAVNETFSNIGSGSSYTTISWVGDDGGPNQWVATDARADQIINGKAILIRNGNLTTPTFTGGIGTLQFITQRMFAGGDSLLRVKVNGNIVDSVSYNSSAQVVTINNINLVGNITVEISTPQNGDRVAIDDLKWTPFGTTPTVNQPTNFTAQLISASQINLSWSLNANNNNVLVAFSKSNNFANPAGSYLVGDFIDVNDTTKGKVIYTGNSTFFSHQNLQPNTTYYYQIWSYDATPDYSFPLTANQTTSAGEPTFHVTGLSADSVTYQDIIISWVDALPGNQVPENYLLLGKNASAVFPVVIDGTPIADDTDFSDGLYAVNIPHIGDTQTYTFTGLSVNEAYTFEIYPYTNTGSAINYKTNNPPTLNASTTSLPAYIIHTENFDNCTNNTWTTYDQLGATDVWQCNASGYMAINGFGDEDDIDWLFSPQLDLTNYGSVNLSFDARERFSGPDFQLMYSSNYSGTGNPSAATWVPINVGFIDASTNSTYSAWETYSQIILDSIAGQPIYLAFRYEGTAASAEEWQVDNILVTIDVTPPTPTNAILVNATQVLVIFDEPVSATTATNPLNYSGLGTINSITQNNIGDSLTLNLANAVTGIQVLTVSNIADANNNVMTTSVQFNVGFITVPAFQGFEGTTTDNWLITTGSANINTDFGATQTPANQRVKTGLASWSVTNQTASLTLDEVQVNGQTNVFVELYVSSTSSTSGNGADAGDSLGIYVALDGNTFSALPDYRIIGNSNARWSFAETGDTISAAANASVTAVSGTDVAPVKSKIRILIPNGTQTVKLKITANNGTSEFWNVDDVAISSSNIDVTAPTITSVNINNNQSISVKFSENVAQVTAENTANYQGVANLLTATLVSTDSVLLSFSTSFNGLNDTLLISGIEDSSANVMSQYFYSFLYNNLSSGLVITEIMYNNTSFDTLEFVEILNNTQSAITLGGLAITTAFNFTFPAYNLPAGDYAVVAIDTAKFKKVFNPTHLFEASTGTLNNTGELIVLENTLNQIVDSVRYKSSFPWDNRANGDGFSLVLCDVNSNNALGENWSIETNNVDGITFASPGTANNCPQPITVNLSANQLVICEGDTTTISVTASGGSASLIYDWSPNINIVSNINQTIAVNPSSTTNYIIEVTDGFSTVYDTAEVLVNPTYLTNLNSGICVGDTFTFNNKNYTQGGTFFDTLSAVTGCDSIIQIQITPYQNKTVHNANTIAICSGDSALIFGKFRKTAAIYADTFSTIFGCDSISTRQLLVNPKPIVDSITVIGISVCGGSNAEIIVSTQGASANLLYSINNKNTFSSDSIFSNLSAGVYQIWVSNSVTNCQTYVGQEVISAPGTPSAPTISGGATYCKNNNLNPLTATTSGGQIKWFLSQNLTDSIGVGTSIMPLDSVATIIYYAAESNGVCLGAASSVSVTINQTFNVNHSIVICEGSSFSINNKQYSTTGIYVDTLQTAQGCDSIVTTNLTVNPIFNDTISQAICAGDSLFFNNQYRKTSGYYTELYSSVKLCDSLITLNLLVNEIDTTWLSHNLCQGDQFLFYGQNISSAGRYYQVLSQQNSCDSVISLDVSILRTDTTLLSAEICNGDSFLVGGNYQTQGGIYHDTLINALGCDSILITTLTVNPVLITQLNFEICSGDSLYLGGNFQSQSGNYYDTLQTNKGCDSIVVSALVVKPVKQSNQIATICQGDTVTVGNMSFSNTGNYQITFSATNGCDSTVNLQLTVNQTYETNLFDTISLGDSSFFAGKYFSQSGIYQDTLLATSGCDSVLIFNLSVIYPQLPATPLIISQYIETNSGTTPKGIELWNVSGQTIDFSVYPIQIQQGTNGASPITLKTISTGQLANHDVMVVGTSDIGNYLNTQGLASVLFELQPFSFNGDDALRILVDGKISDVFGNPGNDPGSSWDGNGVSTANQNIEIKPSIVVGDTLGWTNPSQRFNYVAAGNNLQGFGISPVYVVCQNDSVFVQTNICQGDSLFVGGSFKKQTGTYFDVFSKPNGCDSVQITNLMVLPNKQTTVNISICSGDSSFVGGTYQKQTGIYFDTVSSALNCDSVIITNLFVNPSFVDTLTASICTGDSLWAGGSYKKQTGIYIDSLTTQLGCDSIMVTNLTVSSFITATVPITICQGDSFLVGGAWQTISGTYVDTIINTGAGCDNIIITQLNVLQNIVTYHNITLCFGDSLWIGGAFQKQSGVFYDSLINNNGCDSVIETTLQILPKYETNVNLSICQGDSIYAAGQFQKTSGTYLDSFITVTGCDSVILTQLTVSTVVTAQVNKNICQGDSLFIGGNWQTVSGTYFDTLLGSSCDSVVITHLMVNQLKQTTLNSSICQGDSIFAGGSFQKQTGVYQDTYSTLLGCDSVVITNLKVFPSFALHFVFEICAGDSLFINGKFQKNAGVYVDTLQSVNGCDSIISNQLIVNPNPAITLTGNTFICQDETSLISATSGYQSYNWNTGSVDSVIAVTDTGIYSVTVTDTNGCVASNFLHVSSIIQKPNKPLSLYSLDTILCPNDTILLDAGIFSSYLWNTGETTREIEVITKGVYSVTVSNTFGCTNSDSIVVIEAPQTSPLCNPKSIGEVNNKPFQINVFPNPNNGQFNLLVTNFVENAILKIYNINGSLVYEKSLFNISAKQVVELNLKHLPVGIYTVNIQSDIQIANTLLLIN